MNRGDTKPFEDQRLGVPGIGTESEADQHLRGMVKNQLDTNVTLERYVVICGCKKQPYLPDSLEGPWKFKTYLMETVKWDWNFQRVRDGGPNQVW